jgi:hypothetical protein
LSCWVAWFSAMTHATDASPWASWFCTCSWLWLFFNARRFRLCWLGDLVYLYRRGGGERTRRGEQDGDFMPVGHVLSQRECWVCSYLKVGLSDCTVFGPSHCCNQVCSGVKCCRLHLPLSSLHGAEPGIPKVRRNQCVCMCEVWREW